MSPISEADLSFVAGQIAARYAHPSRTAYLYLFRLTPGADFAQMPLDTTYIVTAWVDEGVGLAAVSASEAVARCAAAAQFRAARPANAHERRLTMARLVMFNVIGGADQAQIAVDLYSRALQFTPKGDRRALETWRRADEIGGDWYSAPVGRE